MEKPKKLNFLEWNSNIFLNSIKKVNANIILIVVLDALFYFLSGYLVIFWLQRMQAKIAAFNLPADIISLGQERAQQLVSEVRIFYFLIIASFILLLIAAIFLASILKGIIWAKTTNTKLSFKLISKFLVLNLIWMSFWLILIILISLLVQPSSVPMFMLVAILLGLYFTNSLYTIFMKKQEFKSIFNAVRLSIVKIRLFLLPYAVIGLLLYVIVKLSNVAKFRYSQIFIGMILLIYAAIVRFYASALVSEIENLK